MTLKGRTIGSEFYECATCSMGRFGEAEEGW